MTKDESIYPSSFTLHPFPMGDWLKLTTEDIESAQQQAQAAPVLPAVLRIDTADLPDTPSTHATSAGQILRITEAELTAVATAVSPPSPSSTPDPLAQLAFALINQARQQHLPRWLKNRTLRWHVGLAAVARRHSQDMLAQQYIDHVSLNGVGLAQRLHQHGITYLACGENIGAVYGPASQDQQGIKDVHHAFMRQPRGLATHRGNILNPIWTHVGIGVIYREPDMLIVTQNFMAALTGK